MEPNQNKQKSIVMIILIFLFLLSASIAGYLIFQFKSELKIRPKTGSKDTIKSLSVAYINTFTLPPAKADEKYYSEVVATLMGTHADLPISVVGLPDGLSLEECSQKFDSTLISTPNTQTKCFIKGVPIKTGLYNIKISVTNKGNDGGYHTVMNTIELRVSEPQTL